MGVQKRAYREMVFGLARRRLRVKQMWLRSFALLLTSLILTAP
jgi:hypothetical protein